MVLTNNYCWITSDNAVHKQKQVIIIQKTMKSLKLIIEFWLNYWYYYWINIPNWISLKQKSADQSLQGHQGLRGHVPCIATMSTMIKIWAKHIMFNRSFFTVFKFQRMSPLWCTDSFGTHFVGVVFLCIRITIETVLPTVVVAFLFDYNGLLILRLRILIWRLDTCHLLSIHRDLV